MRLTVGFSATVAEPQVGAVLVRGRAFFALARTSPRNNLNSLRTAFSAPAEI